MKEFMFLIRNHGDGKAGLSAEQHTAFVKKCEVYIGKLKAENRLIAAQPLLSDGILLSEKGSKENPVNLNGEIQVGYYHILAADLKEATEIAKQNPEFEFVPNSSIEVRPVKISEKSTGFVYPK